MCGALDVVRIVSHALYAATACLGMPHASAITEVPTPALARDTMMDFSRSDTVDDAMGFSLKVKVQ